MCPSLVRRMKDKTCASTGRERVLWMTQPGCSCWSDKDEWEDKFCFWWDWMRWCLHFPEGWTQPLHPCQKPMCKQDHRGNTDPRNGQSVDTWKTEWTWQPPLSLILQFLFSSHAFWSKCSSFKSQSSFNIKKLCFLPLILNKVNACCHLGYCLGMSHVFQRKLIQFSSPLHESRLCEEKKTPKWSSHWRHPQAPHEYLIRFCWDIWKRRKMKGISS